MSKNSWEEHRLYLLETIKTMNQAIKELDKRITLMEVRMYLILGGAAVVLFLIELYFKMK